MFKIAMAAAGAAAAEAVKAMSEASPNTYWQWSVIAKCSSTEPRWRDSYVEFVRELGTAPDGRTLRRHDHRFGFISGNVFWGRRMHTMPEKRPNTWSRKAKPIVIHGVEFKSQYAARKHYGTDWKLVQGRVTKGWPLEAAIALPRHAPLKSFDNEKKQIELEV